MSDIKKYSVFVSSTYQDLIEERKEVIQALLELDCIPIGMELFPATDDDQWTLIKELINECDYYILIIGGRYGSLNKEGISFTQMEYEYAIEIGVPVISFLHKTPGEIKSSKTDRDSEKEQKLENFRKISSEKLIKYWNSPEELGSIVSRSLIKLIKTKPRIGWVKSDRVSSDEANLEILELKQKIQELENEIKKSEENINKDLLQDDDIFIVKYGYKIKKYDSWDQKTIEVEWNTLFAKTCAILIDEAKEEDFRLRIDSYIKYLTKIEGFEYELVNLFSDNFLSILIQLKALNLVEKSDKKRSLKDNSTYWKLTKKGDNLITKLRAIKRENEFIDAE
ncbi:hypothetical protein FFWV33_14925 [Flavobacterium faecale]|uniref:DUF4062 domain-containing protein n=1 Tax=Flavobacterium faecale TaxID=1355330 RepID=A0A2S1LGR8_9FLAO|nr:DUF4062 domain-containing protein [Flavobacterium faecale]AWG22726.1 hypothetical protein FFWV33_14925 [Flavobacterium faecale]